MSPEESTTSALAETSAIITRQEFIELALADTSISHATRHWRVVTNSPTHYAGQRDYQDAATLDLEVLAGKMAHIETGKSHEYGNPLLSTKRWNILAGIINTRLGSDEEQIILPWDETIHPHFSRVDAKRRREAAKQLVALYEKS